jgi:hypothetical protein
VILAARAFQDRLAAMAVPRVLSTPHPMGRPVGAPGDRTGQRAVVLASLNLLQEAKKGGTIIEFPGQYQPYHDTPSAD